MFNESFVINCSLFFYIIKDSLDYNLSRNVQGKNRFHTKKTLKKFDFCGIAYFVYYKFF